MKSNGFVLCDTETENLHIFEAVIDYHYKITVKRVKLVSQCGGVFKKNIEDIVTRGDEIHIRKICADKQKRGLEICGQCVATLYSDDD